MRYLLGVRWFVVLASLSLVGSLAAAEAEDMRPALLGSGPKSYINRINTASLVKKGQGNGAIMFDCSIDVDGSPMSVQAYGGTPNSEALRQEVRTSFMGSHFIPAVYHHQRVRAFMRGTVTFVNTDGHPRLRLFANQELDELGKEADFIAPQPIHIYGSRGKFVGDPSSFHSSSDEPGLVDLSLTVDATGAIKDIHVLKEEPTGKRYGEAAMASVHGLTFLPAYRNGHAVESTTHYKYYFLKAGRIRLSSVALFDLARAASRVPTTTLCSVVLDLVS